MFDVDAVAESFSNFGRALATALNGALETFTQLYNILKNKKIPISHSLIPYMKKISRKKFIKLLMSYKIQRNEANKIADKIHKQRGQYRLSDVCKYVKQRV